MNRRNRTRLAAALLLPVLAATGCTVIPKPEKALLKTYVLEPPTPASAAAAAATGGPIAVFGPFYAAPGYQTFHMIYLREPYRLQRFAENRWAEPPVQMILPLLVGAAEATGSFGAVVAYPTPVRGDLFVEGKLLCLRHEFDAKPSRVRLTLRIQVLDRTRERLLGVRTFEAVEEAATEDPVGGVEATNRAAARLVREIANYAAGLAGADQAK
ncbi:MAG: ABC-type transport auxiliary lipoprotein family protein [Candidatus Eisenbacteria bacterium]